MAGRSCRRHDRRRLAGVTRHNRSGGGETGRVPATLRFEDPEPVDRERAVAALDGDDPAEIQRIIVGLALNDPDGEWIEELCWRAAEHDDPAVRSMAGLCLGHVARRFGRVRRSSWVVVRGLCDDPATDGRPLDGLADMRQFAGQEPAT